MKKFVALLLVAVLSCAFVLTAAASDYSFLDGMTLEEMIALQSELETRISDAKMLPVPLIQPTLAYGKFAIM